MTNLALHPETYRLTVTSKNKKSSVELTYPQVVRLGKILSGLRTDGVADECSSLSTNTGTLTITRVERSENAQE